MGAAIAEPDQGVRARHHLAADLEIEAGIVGDRREDEIAAVAADQDLVREVDRAPALPPRLGRDRGFLRRLVVRRVAQGKHVLERPEPRRDRRRLIGRRLGQETAPEIAGPHDRQPLVEAEMGDGTVCRIVGEWIQAALQAEQHRDRARRYLGMDLDPGPDRLVHPRQQLAPEVGRRVPLPQGKRKRSPRLLGDAAHHRELGRQVGRVPIRDELEDAAVGILQPERDADQLVLRRP